MERGDQWHGGHSLTVRGHCGWRRFALADHYGQLQ